MMVPTRRLLTGYGIVMIPAALVWAMVPSLSMACLVLGGGIVILFLADAVLSVNSLDHIGIRLPAVVRLSKNRSVLLTVLIDNSLLRPGNLTLGIRFPDQWAEGEMIQTVPLDRTARLQVNWPVTGRRQGRFSLSGIHLEIRSVCGFWAVRKTVDATCEFRIYPDLFSGNRSLAALFHTMTAGAHAMRRLGRGKEFEKLRDYLPGDSYEDIHWKATARRGFPVSKVFQLERTQDIYVMIDNSRLSARMIHTLCTSRKEDRVPGDTATVLESYCAGALALGMAARKLGDNFGLGVFSSSMDAFLPASGGRSGFNAARDMLYLLESRPVSPDFSELITFAGNRIRRRALIIILTCLDDPAVSESLVKNIHILTRRHVVVAGAIRPDSAGPVFRQENIGSVDQIYSAASGHMLWQRLRESEQSLRRQGAGFLQSHWQDLSFRLISRYVDIKQRQMI